jgi:hypothetical protein
MMEDLINKITTETLLTLGFKIENNSMPEIVSLTAVYDKFAVPLIRLHIAHFIPSDGFKSFYLINIRFKDKKTRNYDRLTYNKTEYHYYLDKALEIIETHIKGL